MGHTPYGYTITDGIAVIDETAATKIRCLCKNYLAGMSLTDAAKNAGIETYHGTAKRLLTNSHYIGYDFYPAIIDKNTFALAAQEIHKRADKLGRTNKIPKVSTKYAPTHFSIKKADDNFPNPFKQAEYIYTISLHFVLLLFAKNNTGYLKQLIVTINIQIKTSQYCLL